MYSLIYDFNLNLGPTESERFLVSMMNKWPELYSRVPGVGKNVLFLGNAFALSGKYSFRLIVDLESIGTLQNLDRVMKSDRQWQKARADFIKNRSAVESHLVKVEGGDEDFLGKVNAGPESVLFSVNYAVGGNQPQALKKFDDGFRKLNGVRSHRMQSAVLHSNGHHGYESWVNVAKFDQLESIADSARTLVAGPSSTQLYGVFRVVDGSFVGSA